MKFTFNKCMIFLSIFLSILCIVGWTKLDNFITEFEMSLNIPTDTSTVDIVEHDPITVDEIQRFMLLSEEISTNYAKFTSDDLDFRDISGYFEDGSPILELLESYNSNRYNSHESSYFEDISVSTPVIAENGTIKCEASFNYVVITKDDTHNYPSSYILYFNRDTEKVTSLEMN